MPSYKLIFKADGLGEPKKIEFEGNNAAAAFNVLATETDARHVELWTKGEMIAEITRDRSGLWLLDGVSQESAEP
ncbi:hypothetical protein K3181_03020 [Qipengyuania sp. YG27]|uniref:Uncharacterized protein n=1 Tax=Qipengyuania mesophila TaxID=2867246 RepID=A0ABS7JRZ4_9SPHN|nr:hypothetical protein [Qipengyuania mesophila]MBX7500417.1 hypothetical protein [Qipengyuania mesophila]